MLVTSEHTRLTYETKDAIRIVNVAQAAFYISHDCRLWDIYVSSTDGRLIFVFSKNQTRDKYQIWLAQRPDKDNNNGETSDI